MSWLIIVIALAPPFLTTLVFLPIVFPSYVLITHVGELSDRRLIKLTAKPASRVGASPSDMFEFLQNENQEKKEEQQIALSNSSHHDGNHNIQHQDSTRELAEIHTMPKSNFQTPRIV